MMRMAMKAIPLAHDDFQVEILFEDEHLIVVNKPANLLTAPKHRWMVRPTACVPWAGLGVDLCWAGRPAALRL